MKIPGSVPVTGFIAPTDTADTYAVTDPKYQVGGYREVVGVSDRDNITPNRRRLGMLVYVTSTDKFYQLKTDLGNSGWVEWKPAGGSLPNWEEF